MEPKMVSVLILLLQTVAIIKGRGYSRLVGGHEAIPHSLPHMVKLEIYTGENKSTCGGTIVGVEWVLTAAHCVSDPTAFIVVIAGSHDLSTRERVSRVTSYVDHVVLHDRWNFLNDLALLLMVKPFQFNDFVQPVPLCRQLPPAGAEVVTAGWGRTGSEDADDVSPVLMQALVPLISLHRCQRTYPFLAADSDAILCSAGKRGTCQGDSGGPLLYEGQLIGITSFGHPLGCSKHEPSGFTRMYDYLPWIDRYVQDSPVTASSTSTATTKVTTTETSSGASTASEAFAFVALWIGFVTIAL